MALWQGRLSHWLQPWFGSELLLFPSSFPDGQGTQQRTRPWALQPCARSRSSSQAPDFGLVQLWSLQPFGK